MKRPIGYLSLVLATAALVGAVVVRATGSFAEVSVPILGATVQPTIFKVLVSVAVILGLNGVYQLVLHLIIRRATKRRAHDVRNVLRLAFGVLALIAVLGVLTEQWLGVLFSLGVVGFAITFALQQPLLSLLGWFYIMLKRPYQVGDRVAIAGSKGDVIAVDFLVTTLWEINGELVSSNQPSGRVVTVPNSVVLSSEVSNYGGQFPFVWNELSVQVAYETDLAFARRAMVEEAEAYLGAEMADRIGEYRDALARTPVELDVDDRPSVNVVQRESWVELKLRFVVHPRRGARTETPCTSASLTGSPSTPIV